MRLSLILLLLAGCSSKLAYNNLDWVISWYADDYVSLDDAQDELLESRVQRWLQWHRRQELQRYAMQLQDLRQDIAQARLSRVVVDDHFRLAAGHWISLRDEISPDLAVLAGELSDAQAEQLFATLEADNRKKQQEIDEALSQTVADRQAARQEAIEERVDRVTGDISAEQRRIIASHVPQLADTRGEWLAYRRSIQQAAHSLFAGRAGNDSFAAELADVMTHPDRYRSEQYIRHRQVNRDVYAQMLAELAASLTAEQRATLLETVDDWLEDLQALQQDA